MKLLASVVALLPFLAFAADPPQIAAQLDEVGRNCIGDGGRRRM